MTIGKLVRSGGTLPRNNSHITNSGVFTNTTSGAKTQHHWIESAYMAIEGGALKVKFVSSTAVNW